VKNSRPRIEGLQSKVKRNGVGISSGWLTRWGNNERGAGLANQSGSQLRGNGFRIKPDGKKCLGKIIASNFSCRFTVVQKDRAAPGDMNRGQ
jgi:hypothetical protein